MIHAIIRTKDSRICPTARIIAQLYIQRYDQSRLVVIPSFTRHEAWDLDVPFRLFVDPRAFMYG